MRRIIRLIPVITLVVGCSIHAPGGIKMSAPPSLHDGRNSETILRDNHIETDAGRELNAHNDIRDRCHFNITAYNGKVLLTGEAPSKKLKDKIANVVRVIAGVKLVHNEILVREPTSLASRSADALITTKVQTALSKIKNLPGFDASRVKVVTENGSVFLMGLVHSKEGTVSAEMARREEGVKKVVKVFEYIN